MAPTSTSRAPRCAEAETELRSGRRVLARGLYNFFDVWTHYRKCGWTARPGGPLSYDHFYVKPGKSEKRDVEGEDFVYGEAALVAYALREKIFGEPPPPLFHQEKKHTSNTATADSDVRSASARRADVLAIYSNDESGALCDGVWRAKEGSEGSEQEWSTANGAVVGTNSQELLAGGGGEGGSQTSRRPLLRTAEFATLISKTDVQKAARSLEKGGSVGETTSASKQRTAASKKPPVAVSIATPLPAKHKRKSSVPQRKPVAILSCRDTTPDGKKQSLQPPSVSSLKAPPRAENATISNSLPDTSAFRSFDDAQYLRSTTNALQAQDEVVPLQSTTSGTTPLWIPRDEPSGKTLLSIEKLSFPSQHGQTFRVCISSRDDSTANRTTIVIEHLQTREQWECAFEDSELVDGDESSRQLPDEIVLEALMLCLRWLPNTMPANEGDAPLSGSSSTSTLLGKVDLLREDDASVCLQLLFPCYDFWKQERRFAMRPMPLSALTQQLLRELEKERNEHAATRSKLDAALTQKVLVEIECTQLRTLLRSFKAEEASERRRHADLQEQFRELQQAFLKQDRFQETV